ncbi:hypothetical protein F4803DRAFT_553983 [Xylaria telfairii]|nr:hypothetical protein F4803DRAFT_553983 [Xylaria telfairii]
MFLCRVAGGCEGQQWPLEALIPSDTPPVDLFPTKNILWQIMPKVNNSVLTMRTVAFLESLFAPTQETTNRPIYRSLSDWFSIQTTKPALRSTGQFGVGDWFCVQFNLRACIPDEKGNRNKYFKPHIPDLSRGENTIAIEYLISVSMVLRKRASMNSASAFRYDIVAWVHYDTDFKQGIGKLSFQSYLAVSTKISALRIVALEEMPSSNLLRCLRNRLIIGKKRWNSLMFDDSLQLSEQYFTILQLLRICHDWIGETERGIKNLGGELIQKSESWKAWQQEHAQDDLSQWSLDMTKLGHNVTCLQNFFGTRASPLRERIRIKKEDVSSLQDALLSTSSLRETLKAKTLNLYIGVFTTVTVFFTPLGFIATIPFLQASSENKTPKGFKETFVAVPMLTYILSGFITLCFWAQSSAILE